MIHQMFRTCRLGIRSLMLHKLRSSLTMLGLLFGVASVIAMLAVGEGANFEALEQIKAMGSTNLMLRSQRPPETQASSQGDEDDAFVYGLTYKDVDRVRAMFVHAEEVVSVRETPKSLSRGSNWSSSVVVGASPAYLAVSGMTIAEGRWISPVDMERRVNVAVLGATAAAGLF